MDEGEPQVWPLWGRVLFWVVVALVLAGALIAALGSGRLDARSVRVAVSVVLVPGIALLVVALISRRRASRSVERLDTQLADVAREVAAEEARPETQRTTGASSLALQGAAGAADEARSRLAAGDLERAEASVAHLAESTSRWDRSAPASQAIEACRRTATGLARARQRAARTTR